MKDKRTNNEKDGVKMTPSGQLSPTIGQHYVSGEVLHKKMGEEYIRGYNDGKALLVETVKKAVGKKITLLCDTCRKDPCGLLEGTKAIMKDCKYFQTKEQKNGR